MSGNRPIGTRWTARGPLALVYVFAGVTHLRSPEFFLPIVPGWVPQPELVVHPAMQHAIELLRIRPAVQHGQVI